MEQADQGMRKFISWLGMLSGAILVLIMMLMCAEVFCRYFLNKPILGTVEISAYSLVFFVFCGVAYTQSIGGHIKIDMFTRCLNEDLQRLLRIIACLLALCVFILIARQSAIAFWKSWQMNEVRWGALPLPIYPVKGVVAFGSFILCIQFAIDIIDNLKHRPNAPEKEV
jgi:TRAP-type C4-dicarboxylate transport system permease small subunit